MEKSILSAMLKDRGTYELFERIGSWDDFSPLGRSVGRVIAEYYDLDRDVRSATKEFVEGRLLAEAQNPKHRTPIKDYFRSLPDDVSTLNVDREIRSLHREAIGGKLSLALANGAPKEDVAALIAQYTTHDASGLGEGKRALVDIKDTSDLTADRVMKDYIRLWPKALNDRLDGGALKGHHVLVWARPEMGKTAFAVNLCAGFLHQKLRVLYVCNEEPLVDVRNRIWARLLKITKQELRGSPEAAAERIARADIGDLLMTDESPTFAAIRGDLRRFKADVLVIDQLRNMRVTADSKNAQLEAAANEARAVGKDSRLLVVSITQAGDSATGKVFLDMSDVDNSKTGIPGAVDLMIGVGADEAMKLNGLLGISLPKNKLGGLHDKFTVSVNFQTGVLK